jgi:hypothetical protein
LYGISVEQENGLYGSISIGSSANSVGIVSGISIYACIFSDLNRGTFGGSFTASGCFITGSIDNPASNSLINNCIIFGSVKGSMNSKISHNIIYNGITQSEGTFFNNIIFPTISPSIDFPNNSKVFNNVCVGCTGAPSFNNFFTTAANTIFSVGEPRNIDDLWDDRFKLNVSSPAKTKGVAGVDCGPFAGPKPYVLSGIPPFPMITAFTQGAPSGGNIPITISIKRN